jgi:hypothetical protein
VRADDIDHAEFLELDPEGGVIRFAGQRALLVDAVAMGLLRQYLVQNFGLAAARAVLTQFGFAHGWRMAAALRDGFEWADVEEWRRAGPRLCTLEGLFRTQPGSEDPSSERGAMLLASYEAEQHLLHFGRSDTAACWTICGLLSGYLSQVSGTETYVLEERCLGQGHAACRLRGRTREEWGEERTDALIYFDAERLEECLDVSLSRVTRSLKAAEEKLRARRRVLARVVPAVDESLGVVAKSPRMQAAVELARRVAVVDATVLITGESGVGKEHIARLIHDESARAAGPFIAVNCGAITDSLLESELFGHARGAFTGAGSDRPGLFEAANKGTLLLDEIGGEPEPRRGRARPGRHEPRPHRACCKRLLPQRSLLPAERGGASRSAASRSSRGRPSARPVAARRRRDPDGPQDLRSHGAGRGSAPASRVAGQRA